MKDVEKILKALANRRRLAIIQYLKNTREASVGDIAAKIKLSFKSTSRHLSVLSSTNILDKEQRSLSVFYRLSDQASQLVKSVIKFL